MKQEPLFQGTPEDFQDLFNKITQKEFEILKAKFQLIEYEEYLGRQQEVDILHIDLESVHNLRKKAVLIAYQIDGKNLFKRSEIEVVELKIRKK